MNYNYAYAASACFALAAVLSLLVGNLPMAFMWFSLALVFFVLGRNDSNKNKNKQSL